MPPGRKSQKGAEVPAQRVRRRGAGEGSVYRTSEGTWRAVADLGWYAGRRQRKYVRGASRGEVLQKLRLLQREAEAGVVHRDKVTVEQWLGHWMDTVVAGRGVSERTVEFHEGVVRHLTNGLGKVALCKLTPEDVDGYLRQEAAAGLSRSYLGRIRAILVQAVSHAEARGMVARNAAALSVMPRAKPSARRRSLTPEEARAFIGAAENEPLRCYIVVGLMCGLRPGELGGLLWDDVDIDGDPPTLTVSGSMKRRPDATLYRGEVKRSKNGRRTVALPPTAVDALRLRRKEQEAEREAAGTAWTNQGLVFASENGNPLDPSNVRRSFRRIAERSGLDASFPYLLRHTSVSLILDAGASIDEAADLLGDDPRTLYAHYRHKVRPVADAALRMEAVLCGRQPNHDL